jgi:hypothetical protein
MTPFGPEPVELRIAEMVEPVVFIDEADLGEVVIRTAHRVEPAGTEGSRVTARAEGAGPSPRMTRILRRLGNGGALERTYFSQSPISYAEPGVAPTTISVVGDAVASNLRLTAGPTDTIPPAGIVTASPSSVAWTSPAWTK